MSHWSDEVKDLLRENPSVFSTRVIMRQFAYKKVSSASELKAAIKSYLSPKTRPPRTQAKSAQAQISLQEKKERRAALTAYLTKQKKLSSLIKDEIKKAFAELNLI